MDRLSLRATGALIVTAALAVAIPAAAAPPPDEEREVERTCKRLADDRRRGTWGFGPEVLAGLERILGCGHVKMWPGDRIPEDTSSAVASVGWVGGCLAISLDDLPDRDGLRRRLPAYAVCGAEGRAISAAAFDAELDRLHVALGARPRARRYLGQLQATLAELDEHLAPQVKRDPALRELFYGAPEQAWKDGRANVKRGAAQRAAVAAFEADLIHGRSSVRGCAVKLRDSLLARLRAAKVADVDRAILGSRDAIGQPVLRALVACARAEDQPAIVEAAREVLGAASDHEGVRTLMYWYVHDEVRKLRHERADFWISEADLPRPPSTAYPFFDTEPFDRYLLRAPIEAVARKGGDVQLRFGEVSWKEHERECRETDQAQSIDRDGRVRYRRDCKDLGVKQKAMTEAPVLVAAEHAGALAAGRTAELMCDRRGERRRCFPLFVWQDAARKQLVGYLGAEL
jgi:hypothetical protein